MRVFKVNVTTHYRAFKLGKSLKGVLNCLRLTQVFRLQCQTNVGLHMQDWDWKCRKNQSTSVQWIPKVVCGTLLTVRTRLYTSRSAMRGSCDAPRTLIKNLRQIASRKQCQGEHFSFHSPMQLRSVNLAAPVAVMGTRTSSKER